MLSPFVQSAVASSNMSGPSGVEITGTVMAIASTTTASDSFGTVMGFVEKFVQIGDAIAEVGCTHSEIYPQFRRWIIDRFIRMQNLHGLY